ncbi:MAG: magnesium chelatase subunit H [Promethearchaeota archaeon]
MNLNTDNQRDLPKITLITASVFLKWLTEGIIDIYNQFGKIFDFKIFFLNDLDSGKISKEEVQEAIYESKVLLIDIRGNSPTVEFLVKSYEQMEKNQPELFETKEIIALVGGNREIRSLTKMGPFQARKIPSPQNKDYNIDEIPDLTKAVRFGQRMTDFLKFLGKVFPFKILRHARYWVVMMDYWVYGLGGIAENHKNMLLFLLKHYLGYKNIKVPKPKKIPSFGIYDPQLNEYFNNTEDYFSKKPIDHDKQTIGIFFYGGLYFEQSLPIVKEFMKNFSELNILPVFSDVLTNVEAYKKLFFKDGVKLVSAVINLQYFQLNGGPFGGDGSITKELFKKLDIPQFNPIIQYDMAFEEYSKSNEGINPINQVIAIVMPELDGRIEMTTAGCLRNLGYSDNLKSDILEVQPIAENVKFCAQRIKKWLKLRLKDNSEKKLAIIIYNYPPGEDKIGNAAYLDVSESVKNLIIELNKEGYNTKTIPESKNLMDLFIDLGVVNTPKYMNIQNYKGHKISVKNYLKFFKTLPSYLQDEIIEYWGVPPGKIMLTNSHLKLPIIQFGNIYICLQPSRSKVSGDPNEYHNKNLPPHHQYIAFYRYLQKVLKIDAMIHLGTHGTEEFLPGKECAGWIYDYNLNLISDIPNIYYYHITNTSESAIAKRRGNAIIINHAGPSFKDSGLYQEFAQLELLISEYQNISPSTIHQNQKSVRLDDLEKEIQHLAKSMNFEYKNIEELEDQLYRYKASVIPMGLHILGKSYSSQQKNDLVRMIILHSTEKPNFVDSFLSYFKNKEKIEVEKLESYLNTFSEYYALNLSIEEIHQNLVSEYSINEEINQLTIKWIINLIYRIENSMELDNIIHALEGGYIEPGLGGDPIRSPHIYPTGKNSYGFDPRLIPNSTAMKRGNEIAEKLIQNYKDNNNEWPETVSVVLWAFETMKTGGETIGQIFNYLGVKPLKNKSIWTTELEIIPLEEMNHPRINVIITICGIFRDTFPYHLELINKAIELVAELDEDIENNFVKKSILTLKKKGLDNVEARVFGPPPGKYNTNLTEIISAGKWKDEKELAEDYLGNMSFAYMKNQKVKQLVNNFRLNINDIKLMSQIRDSSEYSITDLDHYYEFTGGLARTYKQINGNDANVYIADSSSKEIKVNTLQESIKEGAITRSLNPKWINSLLKHKYHGGQKIAERIENFLGLSATTHEVDNWIWDKAYIQYIENEELREKLKENNRFAMMDIIKNMLQAEKRGYWDANEEQINNLKKIYLEMENWVELTY